MTLPSEVRSQILREIVPREYNIYVYGANRESELKKNPDLQLLLVNHMVFTEAASLTSIAVANFESPEYAIIALRRCPRLKKKCIHSIRLATETRLPPSVATIPAVRERLKQKYQHSLELPIDTITSVFEEVVVKDDETVWSKENGEGSGYVWCFVARAEIRVSKLRRKNRQVRHAMPFHMWRKHRQNASSS